MKKDQVVKKSKASRKRRHKKSRPGQRIKRRHHSELQRKKQERARKKRRKHNIFLLFCSLGLGMIFSFIIIFQLYQLVTISDKNMAPSLEKDTLVLVNRKTTLRRNSLVLVKQPSGYLTSRIVALPNDTLSYESGKLVVNGVERLQKNVTPSNRLATEDFQLRTTGYYLLGDNRENAVDSRNFGPVKAESIVGVIEAQLFRQ